MVAGGEEVKTTENKIRTLRQKQEAFDRRHHVYIDCVPNYIVNYSDVVQFSEPSKSQP